MKRISEKDFKLAIVLIFAVILLSCQIFLNTKTSFPKAQKGVLDLTNWNFQEDGTITLDGEWEFYWNQLLTYDDFHQKKPPKTSGYIHVPEVWNNYKIDGKKLPGYGYGTYRLRVKVSDIDEIKALKLLNMSMAYKLMVDYDVIAENGKVGTSPKDAIPQYKPQVVSFQNNNKEFEIIIQVSNYTYARGGIWYSIYMGLDEPIWTMKENSLRREMFFLGVVFIMLFYHVAIYWLQKRTASMLYFICMLTAIALRIPVTGEYFITDIFPNVDIRWMVFVEYMGMYWGSTMWVAFFNELYPQETSRKVVKVFICIAVVLTVFTIMAPIHIYTKFVLFYEILAVIMFLYTLYAAIIAAYKKKEASILLLLSILTLLIAFINDALYHGDVIESIPGGVFVFAAFVVIFTQSYVLSDRFLESLNKAEALSERLVSLDRMKDEFLANTSYELRTPLYSIMSIAESILQNKSSSLDGKQEENVSLILSNISRMINLVKEISDYTRLKHNDIQLNKKNVDIYGVVQMVLEGYKYITLEKDIQLKNSIAENVAPIFGDEERIVQIIYYLMEYGIKHIERGKIIVTAVEQKNMIEVSISDTGFGMTEEEKQKVIKLFEDVEPFPEGEYIGSILGLSIVKQLIELQNGKIWFVSEIGKGSKVTFSLPKGEEINTQYRNDMSIEIGHEFLDQRFSNSFKVPGQNKKSTLLIVNSNYMNSQSLMNILSAEGYGVITAIDGRKALDIVQTNPKVDLVILDSMILEISCFEVCKKIRERYSLYSLPIVVLTTQNYPQGVLVALEAGANDFLMKPFGSSELKARVKTLLKLRESVQHAVNAEMAFLQAQVKPHFLYNTLNTIVSFCWTDPSKARELLIEFANYLRGSFDFDNMNKFVSIHKELEFVRSYLFIQKSRFDKKINYNYDVENMPFFMIATLILQPIVDNAVKHGILPKDEGGTISLSIKQSGSSVLIKVSDDGIGMSEEKRLQILNEESSSNKRVGIKNINMRMKHIYGYGLDIQSTENKGTTVTIKIPLERDESYD